MGGLEYFERLLCVLATGRSHACRTVDQEKFCIAFICHGAGEAGLACAGRAVEQHPSGRIDTQALEQFRIAEGKLYHFAKLINGFGHPANIIIGDIGAAMRSEEHTSELQSLMRISYAVFCLKKKNDTKTTR